MRDHRWDGGALAWSEDTGFAVNRQFELAFDDGHGLLVHVCMDGCGGRGLDVPMRDGHRRGVKKLTFKTWEGLLGWDLIDVDEAHRYQIMI